MTGTQKWMIAAVGVPILIFVSPMVFTLVSTQGYYADSFCMCGHDTFLYIKGDGLFTYSPGHGNPPSRLFTLRQQGVEWDALNDKNKVAAHVRFQDGKLCISYSGTTSWRNHDRIINPWGIWIPSLLSKASSSLGALLDF